MCVCVCVWEKCTDSEHVVKMCLHECVRKFCYIHKHDYMSTLTCIYILFISLFNELLAPAAFLRACAADGPSLGVGLSL